MLLTGEEEENVESLHRSDVSQIRLIDSVFTDVRTDTHGFAFSCDFGFRGEFM